MWTRCKACEESMQTAERHRQDIAENRARAAKLDAAQIPLRFRAKTLESYSVRHDEQAYAKAKAESFAEHFAQHKRQGTFLVLSGTVGTGKTHLALAIAQHVISNNTVFYTSAIDAIRSIRATWRLNSGKSEAQALAEFTGVDLLIIDEIGVQYGTESEQMCLFDIIDKRYRDVKPTILISNLTKAELKGFLGERSFDRLREGGLWVDFLWESFRGN
jgi:DNA replication protein DnaC